jgi:hypothetical protein
VASLKLFVSATSKLSLKSPRSSNLSDEKSLTKLVVFRPLDEEKRKSSPIGPRRGGACETGGTLEALLRRSRRRKRASLWRQVRVRGGRV